MQTPLRSKIQKTHGKIAYFTSRDAAADNWMKTAVVQEILVCHQHEDDTKWGRGMSVSHYVRTHLKYSCDTCGSHIQSAAINMAKQLLQSKNYLRQQVAMSRILSNTVPIPDYHRFAYVSNTQTIRCECNMKHTVTVNMYGMLLDQQHNYKWYKGGIVIDKHFQAMKWRF
jgi:hypothetical protein